MRTCAKRRRPGPPGTSETTPSGHRLVERLEQLVFSERFQPSERVERELASEHRRQHQYPVAFLREVGEPAGDDVADALRDGEPGPAVDSG